MSSIERYYRVMLPIVGLLCIVVPGRVARWLPSILGSIMVLTSVTDMIFIIKEKRYLITYRSQASSLILFIMGICFLLGQQKALLLMGVTWGILGLQEVNEELEEVLIKKNKKEKWKVSALLAGMKLVLSLELIFEPIEKFEFHIVLLGLEILAVTVKEKSVAEYVIRMKIKHKRNLFHHVKKDK